MSTHKEIYEALQAVNARLDAVGEQLLIGFVEEVRASVRAAVGTRTYGAPDLEATLKIWVEVDAAEGDGPLPQPAWHDMRTAEEAARSRLTDNVLSSEQRAEDTRIL